MNYLNAPQALPLMIELLNEQKAEEFIKAAYPGFTTAMIAVMVPEKSLQLLLANETIDMPCKQVLLGSCREKNLEGMASHPNYTPIGVISAVLYGGELMVTSIPFMRYSSQPAVYWFLGDEADIALSLLDETTIAKDLARINALSPADGSDPARTEWDGKMSDWNGFIS